jgi:tetratricopeptide (TPR) repeat protein
MFLHRVFTIRSWGLRVGLSVCLVAAAVSLAGQNGTPAKPSPAGQQDNPFPEDPQKAPATPPAPKTESDNPFPGEDTNAPIIPVDPGPGAAPNSGYAPVHRGGDSGTDSANAPRPEADPEGDPVRSPDPAGMGSGDGFSSSRSGMSGLPAENDSDAVQGQSAKHKTREEKMKEDLDTGGFYAEKRNWKASQSRYADAFALDKENADAVWGLAEAERHLQMYKEASEHYKLFLSYDPDGPHSRAARKALDQVLEAQSASNSLKSSESSGAAPK